MQEIQNTKFIFERNVFYIEGLDKTFININIVTEYIVTEKTFSYFGLLEPLEIAKKQPRLLRKTLERHCKKVKKYLKD